MKSLDWQYLGQPGEGHWIGFDGLRIVARIMKRDGLGYQWYACDGTGFACTARDAMDICAIQAEWQNEA